MNSYTYSWDSSSFIWLLYRYWGSGERDKWTTWRSLVNCSLKWQRITAIKMLLRNEIEHTLGISAATSKLCLLIGTNTLLKRAYAVKSTLRAPKNWYRWFQLIFCTFNVIKHFGWSQKPATWSPLGNCVCLRLCVCLCICVWELWVNQGVGRLVSGAAKLRNVTLLPLLLLLLLLLLLFLFFCHFHVARELCVLQSLCKWNLQLSRVQRFCCCFKIETFIYKQSQSPAAYQKCAGHFNQHIKNPPAQKYFM